MSDEFNTRFDVKVRECDFFVGEKYVQYFVLAVLSSKLLDVDEHQIRDKGNCSFNYVSINSVPLESCVSRRDIVA